MTNHRFLRVILAVLFVTLAAKSFSDDQALALSKAPAQAQLFARLTDAERDMLHAATTLRRGQAGERIIEQGRNMDKMSIILGGETEIRISGKHVVTLSGQALVGEIEFLDTLPASADVLLLKETELLELNNAALRQLMEKQPRLGYVLMREIAQIEARRLRNTNPK